MPHDTLTATRKADFSEIYDQPDPRSYYSTLSALDYQIPQQALGVFDAVIDTLEDQRRTTTVLDVCCSYGVNAALIRHGVDLAGVTRHYDELAAATPAQVCAADRGLFAHPVRPELTVLGLDASQPAIDHAVDAGLMADGWAEDLETAEPSPELAAGIKGTNLVISTGGVGYVGRPTFERLIGAIDRPDELWLAIFVLRVFDYSDVADLLGEYGLHTEKLEGIAFPQRRFADHEEQVAAMDDVRARGLDPTGKEADGWYHADCYISRPHAVADIPIMRVLSATL